jgi:hypothetical protein
LGVVDVAIELSQPSQSVEQDRETRRSWPVLLLLVDDFDGGLIDEGEDRVEAVQVEHSQQNFLHSLHLALGVSDSLGILYILNGEQLGGQEFLFELQKVEIEIGIAQYLFLLRKLHHLQVLTADADDSLDKLAEVAVSAGHFLHEVV